jgi:hypothetical protein
MRGESVDASEVARWVERYVGAWNSNDPDDIRALFTEGADYLTEPYAKPWRGHDEIVAKWIANKDEPGETEFSFEVIATEGRLGLMRGETIYKNPPRAYDNLWEITLADDGRATRFVEWWMKRPNADL